MAQEVDAISFLRQRYGQGQAAPAQPGSAVDWLRSKYAVAPAATEGPGVMDYAGQGASSFAKGALETGRSLLDFPATMGSAGAALLGMNEAADTAKTLSPHYWAARGLQALERMVPTNAKVDAEQGGAAKWMSETGANALGSTLPFLGVGAIAKGAGATARAATAITALTGASVNAVSGYEDAVRSGANPEQAFGALLINGGLGALEAATPARILARIDAKVGGGLGKAITNAFIEGGTEAMTEMIQQLGQDAYAAMSFDEQRDISQGLADAAGGGGFAGVLMSLLGSGMARGHQAQAAQPKPGAAVQPAPSQAAQEPVSEGQITKDGPTLQPNDARVSGALESLTRKAGEPVTVVEDQKGYEWEADRARMAGTPLVLFRVGEGKGEGENVPTGFSRGGVTFLNADLPVPERKKAVLYHELGHRLFETDEASWKAKYDEIGALAPELLKRAGDRYEANFGEKLSPEAKSEEAYSALAEELPGFIRAWEENPSQFTETKRGFVRKIIDWLSEKLGMESSVTKELKALRDQIAETDFEKSADPKLLRDVSRVFAKGFAELENAPAAEPIQMGSTMVEAPGAAPSETPLQASEPIASRKPRAVGPQPVEMPSGDLYDEQGRPIVGSWGRGPQAVEAKGPTTTKGDLSVPEPAPEPELPTKPSPLTRKSKAQLEQDLEHALQTERERVELVFQDRGKLWRERFIELRQSARREISPAQEAAAKQVRAVEAQLRPRALEVLQGGHEPGMNTEAIMGALRAKEAESTASRLERRSTNREESRAAGEKAQEAARRVGREERFAVDLTNTSDPSPEDLPASQAQGAVIGQWEKLRKAWSPYTEGEYTSVPKFREQREAFAAMERVNSFLYRGVLGAEQEASPLPRGYGPEQLKSDLRTVKGLIQTWEDRRAGMEGEPAEERFSVAYHGSPYDFDEFRSEKIGTGEGAQAYGHGLYFTDKREIAEHYRKRLVFGKSRASDRVIVDGSKLLTTFLDDFAAGKRYRDDIVHDAADAFMQALSVDSSDPVSKAIDILNTDFAQSDFPTEANKETQRGVKDNAVLAVESLRGKRFEVKRTGRIYRVDLAPSEDEYLLWDKPLSEQSEKVKAGLRRVNIASRFDESQQVRQQPDGSWGVYGTDRALLARYASEQDAREHYKAMSSRDFSGGEAYGGLARSKGSPIKASEDLRAAGIRGIKYLAGDGSRAKQEGTYNYVIFDAADVKIVEKFAVAPKGNFATPDETHADTFLRKIQDRYRRLSVIQGAISRKQAISESADAEQKVRLFPSRLRTRFEKVENRQKKVVEILSKNKISVEDAGEFVYALGAEQRNATMAKRNPRKFGTAANPGSGMTDADAQRIQAEAYAKNKAAYEAIRDEVASMNKAKLDMAEESGFLNAEGRKAWEEAFGPYHAPLYTWEKESDDAFSGLNTRNFNNAERLSKKAKGRMSLADNPLVSLIDSMAKWSVRAETNRVGQTLGNLIEEAPDPVLWEPIDSMSKAKPEDQVFSYWQDGEKKLVILHDAKLARAMKSIGVEPAGELLRMAQGVRTTYSKLHTSWNPEFILPNLIKDAGAAAVTLNLEKGPAFTAKALNPNRIRESFFAILNDTNGKPSKLSKEIAEWKDRGGMTGWSLQPETLHKRMKQLDRAVSLAANDTTGKKAVNAFMSGKKLMESLSESAENAVRFSVYRTFLEAGASPDEAARQSKTITIDFDARGEISTPFNVLYLFFNANVQGTARIFQAAKKSPPHRLITTGVALATFGYFVSYINRILADDDENGVNRWDTVSQNDKAHNLSLMFGDKRTILPLPWGWSLFTYLGQQAEALQNGRYKPGQAAGDFTAQSFDSFSPVQGATPTQFLAPWFADPFIQVFENEDFAGRSIMPREDPFKRYKTPDSYRYFPDVDPSLRKAADALNRWTGGDQVNPGVIDMSPEAMEHLAGEAAGGFGRVIGRVAKAIDKLGHGESLKLSEAPVLRRFMQEAPQWFTYKLFSENLTEVERQEELRKSRMPFDAAVVGQGRSTRNQIEEINRAIKRLPDGPVKKRMEDRKLEVEQRFNRFMESRQR